MDEWLSDREHGGFYASQDADINLDDDGDYFTWTWDEAKAVLSERGIRGRGAALRHRSDAARCTTIPPRTCCGCGRCRRKLQSRMGIDVSKALDLLASAKTKLYAARLQRPTPFVDKTVYVNWNAMCVSAYLQAAQVLGLDDARKFALRSLDRILAERVEQRARAVARDCLCRQESGEAIRSRHAGRLCLHRAGLPGCLRGHRGR